MISDRTTCPTFSTRQNKIVGVQATLNRTLLVQPD